LTLAQAEVTLYQGERPLVTATVTQKVKLPRKFDGTILIPVKIRFEGGILGMLQTVSLLSQGAKGTSVSGRVVAKAGLGRKKYEFKEMGTERFLKQFGIDLSQIMKELKP
ncbi:MAG: hypothetical protein PHV49_03305, partial [Alistipes sp.]|nr:hypothetical protein [Alistipes sp.]